MLEARSIPRLLAGWRSDRQMTLAEHRETHGELRGSALRAGSELIAEIDAAGLRGRGGSGFPAATKMRAVASAKHRRGPVVVANGSESEPTSAKDAYLLARAPHLVLDGVAAAGAAVGASTAIVCVKETSLAARRALEAAIAERAGLDRVQCELVDVPAAYVAGEESALVNLLNTGLSLPTFVPPRPFERGVDGRPTLIQNVETLAHVSLIARNGAEWFRGLGIASDSGSTLVTIDGAVASPGVYEIECGTPLDSLLATAGGATEPVQACLIGGYGGTWLTAEETLEMPLVHGAAREGAAGLGPGLVSVLPRGACGLSETAEIARYLADQSAGQCGPCTFGLPAIADALDEIAAGIAQPGTSRWVKWWANQVEGRGACHHPDGAVRMIRSALRVFADDLTRHETGEGCIESLTGAAIEGRL